MGWFGGKNIAAQVGKRLKIDIIIRFVFVYDYLLPSFSNTRGPCSSHSCLEIHMSSLSAICCLR